MLAHARNLSIRAAEARGAKRSRPSLLVIEYEQKFKVIFVLHEQISKRKQ